MKFYYTCNFLNANFAIKHNLLNIYMQLLQTICRTFCHLRVHTQTMHLHEYYLPTRKNGSDKENYMFDFLRTSNPYIEAFSAWELQWTLNVNVDVISIATPNERAWMRKDTHNLIGFTIEGCYSLIMALVRDEVHTNAHTCV